MVWTRSYTSTGSSWITIIQPNFTSSCFLKKINFHMDSGHSIMSPLTQFLVDLYSFAIDDWWLWRWLVIWHFDSTRQPLHYLITRRIWNRNTTLGGYNGVRPHAVKSTYFNNKKFLKMNANIWGDEFGIAYFPFTILLGFKIFRGHIGALHFKKHFLRASNSAIIYLLFQKGYLRLLLLSAKLSSGNWGIQCKDV